MPGYLFGCLRFSASNKTLPVIGWVLFFYKNRSPFPIVRSGLYFYSLIEILSNTLYTPAECIVIQAGPLELESTTHGLSVPDRKSTRLNSSHVAISYAVFCLKKKIK